MLYRFCVLDIPTCKYESCRLCRLGNREFSSNIQVFNSLEKINMLLISQCLLKIQGYMYYYRGHILISANWPHL